MNENRGFSLIELMIVVAIVAILAAIAYPSYQEQIRKTRRGQAKADLMELTQGFEREFTASRDYTKFAWPFSVSPRDAGAGGQHYNLQVVAATAAATYNIEAVPTGAQASDRCGTLTISHLGQKTHSAGTDDYCGWGTAPAP